MSKPRVWISFARWHAMTPSERAQFEADNPGEICIDLTDDTPAKPGNPWCGDNEEYAGEANHRHVDHRGFNEERNR